jgi:hypothetical protein
LGLKKGLIIGIIPPFEVEAMTDRQIADAAAAWKRGYAKNVGLTPERRAELEAWMQAKKDAERLATPRYLWIRPEWQDGEWIDEDEDDGAG